MTLGNRYHQASPPLPPLCHKKSKKKAYAKKTRGYLEARAKRNPQCSRDATNVPKKNEQ